MTPQQKRILNLLADKEKHCFAYELYIKDDRTRLSELRKMGYKFNEGAGTCSDPSHRHSAKMKLRQLVRTPLDAQNGSVSPDNSVCCQSYRLFLIHSRECDKEHMEKEIIKALW